MTSTHLIAIDNLIWSNLSRWNFDSVKVKYRADEDLLLLVGKQTDVMPIVYYLTDELSVLFHPDSLEIVGIRIETFESRFLASNPEIGIAWNKTDMALSSGPLVRIIVAHLQHFAPAAPKQVPKEIVAALRRFVQKWFPRETPFFSTIWNEIQNGMTFLPDVKSSSAIGTAFAGTELTGFESGVFLELGHRAWEQILIQLAMDVELKHIDDSDEGWAIAWRDALNGQPLKIINSWAVELKVPQGLTDKLSADMIEAAKDNSAAIRSTVHR